MSVLEAGSDRLEMRDVDLCWQIFRDAIMASMTAYEAAQE